MSPCLSPSLVADYQMKLPDKKLLKEKVKEKKSGSPGRATFKLVHTTISNGTPT